MPDPNAPDTITPPPAFDAPNAPAQTPPTSANIPPAAFDAPTAPAQQPPMQNSAPMPAAPPAPTPPGSVWKQILQGALSGLAGAQGAKSFGAGLAGGAAGYIEDKQRQTVNAQNQQQINQRQQQLDTQASQVAFANQEAAARVANFAANSRHVELLNAGLQQQLDTVNQGTLDTYKKLGVAPVLVVQDHAADAAAALQKAGQMYNGQIPPLSSVTVNGTHYIFDAGQISQADSERARALVNQSIFETTGQKDSISGNQWYRMDPKVQAARVDQALQQQAMNPVADLNPKNIEAAIARTANELQLFKYNSRENDPEAQKVIEQKKQELALYQSYKKSLDADADAASQRSADVKVAGIQAKALADANKPPKVDNLLIGYQDGNPVAGTQAELQAAGATGITKMPSETASKTIAARELVSPDGLFTKISSELQAIGPQNLGAVAGRWNDFMAGKVGTGPQFTELRNDLGLLSTKIMQAHVGSRGSVPMLDHFKSMADAGKMDFPTLAAALHGEYQYVHGVAMLPKPKAAQASNGGK